MGLYTELMKDDIAFYSQNDGNNIDASIKKMLDIASTLHFPRVEGKKIITVSLTPRIIEGIDKAKKISCFSRTEIVRSAIVAFLVQGNCFQADRIFNGKTTLPTLPATIEKKRGSIDMRAMTNKSDEEARTIIVDFLTQKMQRDRA